MVYRIHAHKRHHPQHYIGFVKGDLGQPLPQHKASPGAKLLAAVNEIAIEWHVVRICRGADRCFERKLKNYKSPLFCRICGGHQ